MTIIFLTLCHTQAPCKKDENALQIMKSENIRKPVWNIKSGSFRYIHGFIRTHSLIFMWEYFNKLHFKMYLTTF